MRLCHLNSVATGNPFVFLVPPSEDFRLDRRSTKGATLDLSKRALLTKEIIDLYLSLEIVSPRNADDVPHSHERVYPTISKRVRKQTGEFEEEKDIVQNLMCRSTKNSRMAHRRCRASFRMRCNHFPIWAISSRDHPLPSAETFSLLPSQLHKIMTILNSTGLCQSCTVELASAADPV